MTYVFVAALLAWLLLVVYFVVETAEGKIKPIIGFPLAFAIAVVGLGTILSAGDWSEPDASCICEQNGNGTGK